MQQQPKQPKTEEPKEEILEVPGSHPVKESDPKSLQSFLLSGDTAGYDLINVRLSLSDVENYDELLPSVLVRALIDPDVPDFFIPIKAVNRRLLRAKRHYLHTAFVRELILLDELPDERKTNER